MRRLYALSLFALIAALLIGCGRQPTYVRGSDVPGLDDPAMSTGLDRRDLEQLLNENMASFFDSRFFRTVSTSAGDPPTAAIMPMRNFTSEHVDSQLQALIGMVETQLIESGEFRVVARELREEILEELRAQQGVEFDSSQALSIGRQLGVHYFVTGEVTDNAERSAEARRVQYFMIMRAISVETGEISWQHQAEITKAVIPL